MGKNAKVMGDTLNLVGVLPDTGSIPVAYGATKPCRLSDLSGWSVIVPSIADFCRNNPRWKRTAIQMAMQRKRPCKGIYFEYADTTYVG